MQDRQLHLRSVIGFPQTGVGTFALSLAAFIFNLKTSFIFKNWELKL